MLDHRHAAIALLEVGQKAKQLLAEAGYPNGLDAGDFAAIPGFPTVAEAAVNDLNAVGIRVRLRQM